MLERITVSGAEPVSLAEAKANARLDVSDFDMLIEAFIATAREGAEFITGRAYRAGVWRWVGADWPAKPLPLVGVASAAVRRWDGQAFVVVPPSAYVCTESLGAPGTVLAPAVGSAWPPLGVVAAGARVQIELTVDPLSPGLIPASVKTYILAHVAAWLKAPEALTGASVVCNPLLKGLLQEQRVFYR